MTILKHNFLEQPQGEEAERFLSWLEHETIDCLRRSLGDAEGTKAAIFLYANRAYEAHVPENLIGGIFGKCVVRAGFREEDEGAVFDLLEFFSQIAEGTHKQPPSAQ